MTNPVDYRHFRKAHPLNAVTGDYDLFAIWPYMRGRKGYDRHGDDRRVLGTVKAWSERERIEHELERNCTRSGPGVGNQWTQGGQGTKLGNMTNRIYRVSQCLNSVIGGIRTEEGGPFPLRNVCWHSDEAARPFVNEVDVPCIAFTPARQSVAIRTIPDFKDFIRWCNVKGFYVTLADGWTRDPGSFLDPGNPDPKKVFGEKQLGSAYAHYVPPDWADGQWLVPPWFNA